MPVGRNSGLENAVLIPTLEPTGRAGDSLRDGTGIGRDGDPMLTLQAGKQHGVAVLCFDSKESSTCVWDDVAGTVTTNGDSGSHANAGGQVAIASQDSVRRLMPVECERLQGLPDNHTLVPVAGKPAADGPRYKQVGNGWAVPHAAWICGRLTAHLDALDARDCAAPDLGADDLLHLWLCAA